MVSTENPYETLEELGSTELHTRHWVQLNSLPDIRETGFK